MVFILCSSFLAEMAFGYCDLEKFRISSGTFRQIQCALWRAESGAMGGNILKLPIKLLNRLDEGLLEENELKN
jgi:hypothetical protein